MRFDPHHHRVQLFTGKGGVGKSSVVAAHALACAEAGLRPLVVELGHRATMESIFGVAPIGYEPTDVGDGVHACNLALEDALIDYVREQVKVRAIARRVVTQPTLRRFFEAAPAVNEVVALRRLSNLASSGAFHPILVDLDATGHALMFLGLADVFEGLVGPGPLRTILDATTSLLRDEERTVLHLVTLPAELPARETEQLYLRLRADRRVAVGVLVINRVPPAPFSDDELARLPTLAAADAELAAREQRRFEHAHAQIEALRRAIDRPTVCLQERAELKRRSAVFASRPTGRRAATEGSEGSWEGAPRGFMARAGGSGDGPSEKLRRSRGVERDALCSLGRDFSTGSAGSAADFYESAIAHDPTVSPTRPASRTASTSPRPIPIRAVESASNHEPRVSAEARAADSPAHEASSESPRARGAARRLETIDTLLERRLVVCVGPGGVGKTTTAAALALRGARLGRRALVLTVDPAKRLADALGLEGLDDRIQRVEGVGPGTLDAAMLDTKASFDALIARVSEGEARDAILNNRVYGAFSKTLARSHAYVAAERLYDVIHAGAHDLVVLDTPPTRSALEILDAPSKLAQFLDQDVLRFFLQERRGIAGTFASLAGLGGAAALELLGRLAGATVVAELVAFFRVLAHLREGFQHRAEVTSALLRDPATAYVLVASTAPTSLDDAGHLGRELARRHAPASLVLFNRGFVAEPGTDPLGRRGQPPTDPLGRRGQPPTDPLGRRGQPPTDLPVDSPHVEASDLARKVAALRQRMVDERVEGLAHARAFVAEVAPGARALVLAEQERDLRTIEDLDGLLSVSLDVGG